MNKEQAINIMKQMAEAIKGTLQEHKIIHSAIEFLNTLEEPKKASSEKQSDGQEVK